MAKQRRPRRTDPVLERTWRERIAAWAASGVSAREFCRARGLSEPSFYAWLRELRERDAATGSAKPSRTPPAFVPVTVVGSPRPGGTRQMTSCKSYFVLNLALVLLAGCGARQLDKQSLLTLHDQLTLRGRQRGARCEGRPSVHCCRWRR